MNERREKHFDQSLGLEPESSAIGTYLQGRRGSGGERVGILYH